MLKKIEDIKNKYCFKPILEISNNAELDILLNDIKGIISLDEKNILILDAKNARVLKLNLVECKREIIWTDYKIRKYQGMTLLDDNSIAILCSNNSSIIHYNLSSGNWSEKLFEKDFEALTDLVRYSDNIFFVLDNKKNKIGILDKELNFKKYVNLEFLRMPWRMSIWNDWLYIVEPSDGKVDGRLLRLNIKNLFVEDLSHQLPFSRPASICIIDDEIFIGDVKKMAIYKLSLKENHKIIFRSEQPILNSIIKPGLFCLDRFSKSIFIYDQKLLRILKIRIKNN